MAKSLAGGAQCAPPRCLRYSERPDGKGLNESGQSKTYAKSVKKIKFSEKALKVVTAATLEYLALFTPPKVAWGLSLSV